MQESDKLKHQAIAENPEYAEVFAKDGLKDEVEMYGDVLRWKPDPLVRWMVDTMDLEDFWIRQGNNKNDPMIRGMYRKMGYSVFGYWEIFFWDGNNARAHEWKGEDNED